MATIPDTHLRITLRPSTQRTSVDILILQALAILAEQVPYPDVLSRIVSGLCFVVAPLLALGMAIDWW